MKDKAEVQRSLLRNPFEKFERKRFFHHCKDLKYIAIDTVLHQQLKESDYNKISEQMVADLNEYFKKIDIAISEDDYGFLLFK